MKVLEKMQTVKVEIPEGKGWYYPIIIGKNILEEAGKYIKEYSKAEKLLVITNRTVYSLFGEGFRASLLENGYEIDFVILEDGEKYKNSKSLEEIWTRSIEFKLERKDAIVALGGGVIGDVAGFAASTYLRGVDFIQIPTTLLAQVDSSVGGKVAINHKLGKNLIGSFYQPKLVLSDTATLNNLPVNELKVGLSEIIKYSLIEKSCNFEGEYKNLKYYLKNNKDAIFNIEPDVTEELVKYCCELKSAVVSQDEKETGLRAILNFGHTIGHAIEKGSNYKNINHGQGVAIGMKGALFIAKELGLIEEDYYKESIELLSFYRMEYKIPKSIRPDSLYQAMLVDKKVLSGKIRFVLPVGPAEVGIFNNIEKETIYKALETLY